MIAKAESFRLRTNYAQDDARLNAEEIQRQLSLLRQQQTRLLEEIDQNTMAE